MSRRLRIFAFLVVVLAVTASATDASVPVVSFSIYAPAQRNSPVRIVGLRYDKLSLRFALSNDSDQPVVGLRLLAVSVAPPGCPADAKRPFINGYSSAGTDHDPQTLIGPHEKRVVIPGEGWLLLPVDVLVHDARDLAASYLHVQVEVDEVDFADGTKLRLHDEGLHAPFDPSLVQQDAGKCSGDAGITGALRMTDRVGFDRAAEKPSYEESGGIAPPRLFFSCRLEGSEAFCPMP